MLKRIVCSLAVIAIVGMSTSGAFAQLKGNGPSVDDNTHIINLGSFRGASPDLSEAGIQHAQDLSGVFSWDLELGDVFVDGIQDPENLAGVVTVPVTGGDLNGIGWDLDMTTTTVGGGLSWGSEAVIGFDTDGDQILDLQVTPSMTGGVITNEINSSGGVLKLIDAGIDDIPVSGGTVDLYFFETFDDNEDAADLVYEAGSSIVLQTVPEPATFSLLGLAGLAILGLRRR